MNLFTTKSDGSYDYVSADDGLKYIKDTDMDAYLSTVNTNI